MRWTEHTIAKQQRSPAGWAKARRSYVFGRGVKDANGVEIADVESVLDGNITPFVLASLAQSKR